MKYKISFEAEMRDQLRERNCESRSRRSSRGSLGLCFVWTLVRNEVANEVRSLNKKWRCISFFLLIGEEDVLEIVPPIYIQFFKTSHA